MSANGQKRTFDRSLTSLRGKLIQKVTLQALDLSDKTFGIHKCIGTVRLARAEFVMETILSAMGCNPERDATAFLGSILVTLAAQDCHISLSKISLGEVRREILESLGFVQSGSYVRYVRVVAEPGAN